MARRRARPSSDGRDTRAIAPRDEGASASREDAGGSSALRKGLDMLARRPYATAALRERLGATFTAAEADHAVARMQALGLLDDRAYAEDLARRRFVRDGYGRHRVRSDLLTRGVSEADADAAIDSVLDDGSERERATAALARFRSRRRAATPESAFRHLVGRGFPADLVRDLLGVPL